MRKNLKDMKKFSFIVVFLLLSSFCYSVYACTSFAVYSENTFYGMNFDYNPSVEMKFCIDTVGDLKVFDMRFDIGNFFASTVAMNSNGLFCNLQELYPEVPPEDAGPGELPITELFAESANTRGSCNDVIDVMNDHRIVMGTISLHSLYADSYGDAMVVEVGQKDNLITRIEGNFIVMTNFPNNEFVTTNYEAVYGAGDHRYKAAYKYLLEHADTFDVDDGFALLESAVNHSMYYPTRCSMVFDPEYNEIYIALEGTFDKIWKVSLEKETVETFKGFDTYAVIDIGDGVLASELVAFESELSGTEFTEPEINAEPTVAWEYTLILLIAVISLIVYRRRTR